MYLDIILLKKYTGNTAHAIDGHEARLEGRYYYIPWAFEVYNNTIINTMFKDGTGNLG